MISEAEDAAPTSSHSAGPVVVAVDFSEDSHAAVAWAGEYARLTGSELLVLHVAHEPAASPGFYRQESDELLRPMVDLAEEMMAEFLAARTPSTHRATNS